MKLGEALNERARLSKRVSELRDVIDGSLVLQEGEDPAVDVTKVSEEILTTIDAVEALVASVNRTNAETTLSDGQTITQALARRDAYAAKMAYFEFVIRKLTHDDPYSYRRAASELRSIRHADVIDAMTKRDSLAQDRRKLDAELQTLNWTTELL